MKGIRLGLIGCGVVGGGVVEALSKHRDRVERACGMPVEISRIAVRDLTRPRNPYVPLPTLCDDWLHVCEADDVDVVIEVMGGQGAARDAVLTAIATGKHVVTANKELLAAHGTELYRHAEHAQVQLRYEASVLGGIPALHTLETYFKVNQIRRLRGIVNGTSNYILTRMFDAQVNFHEALGEAQSLGYAEADPAMDVDGLDAWYKLQILLNHLNVDTSAFIEQQPIGIRGVEAADVLRAKHSGGKIKHVVSAEWDAATQRLALTAEPVFIAQSDPLYHVDGVQNAICIEGDIVGEVMLTGPGAGAFPTASAILEDLVKVVH